MGSPLHTVASLRAPGSGRRPARGQAPRSNPGPRDAALDCFVATLLAMTTREPLPDRLDAFDHLGVFRAVFVPHRLDGILERRLVGDLLEIDVGLFHLV